MMKKSALTLIVVTFLLGDSAGGQDVSAQFVELRQAIDQSSADADAKTEITNWTFIAESFLIDGAKTILANKLISLIKCLVDSYLPEEDTPAIHRILDAIRFDFESKPNPPAEVVLPSNPVPPAEGACSVVITVLGANVYKTPLQDRAAVFGRNETFFLDAESSEPGTFRWEIKPAGGSEILDSGTFAVVALTDFAKRHLLGGDRFKESMIAVVFTSADGERVCEDSIVLRWINPRMY